MSRDVVERLLGITHPVYAWRIDTWPPVEGVGTIEPPGKIVQGPSDAPDELLARIAAGEGKRFRLKDDDGEVYCEGRILMGTDDDEDGELYFAPLHDYGEPGLGCTEIQYREPTERGGTAWTTL